MSPRNLLQKSCRKSIMLPYTLTKMRTMMAESIPSHRFHLLKSNCLLLISWVAKDLKTTTSRTCLLSANKVAHILNSLAQVLCHPLAALALYLPSVVECLLLRDCLHREHPRRISMYRITIMSRSSEVVLAARLRSSRRRSRR